ncbi:MAG: methyltransferase type 11 [Alphaproteobacteria bacterium]|nr:methyltransferase type 11 [Alphaproteobacteria bacterium]
MSDGEPPFTPDHFVRVDNGDDADFYRPERLVHHLDDAGRAALTDFYRQLLPAGCRVLDLMSSWASHLPEDGVYDGVTGLGMNAVELDANPRLTDRLVHDLNADPVLLFGDGSFDACLIALSVQYLVRPLDVFAEIARVLSPGGICAVTFSNRCFPTKAVAIWRGLDDAGHIGLVDAYFRHARGFDEPVHLKLAAPGLHSDPLFAVCCQTEAEI